MSENFINRLSAAIAGIPSRIILIFALLFELVIGLIYIQLKDPLDHDPSGYPYQFDLQFSTGKEGAPVFYGNLLNDTTQHYATVIHRGNVADPKAWQNDITNLDFYQRMGTNAWFENVLFDPDADSLYELFYVKSYLDLPTPFYKSLKSWHVQNNHDSLSWGYLDFNNGMIEFRHEHPTDVQVDNGVLWSRVGRIVKPYYSNYATETDSIFYLVTGGGLENIGYRLFNVYRKGVVPTLIKSIQTGCRFREGISYKDSNGSTHITLGGNLNGNNVVVEHKFYSSTDEDTVTVIDSDSDFTFMQLSDLGDIEWITTLEHGSWGDSKVFDPGEGKPLIGMADLGWGGNDKGVSYSLLHLDKENGEILKQIDLNQTFYLFSGEEVLSSKYFGLTFEEGKITYYDHNLTPTTISTKIRTNPEGGMLPLFSVDNQNCMLWEVKNDLYVVDIAGNVLARTPASILSTLLVESKSSKGSLIPAAVGERNHYYYLSASTGKNLYFAKYRDLSILLIVPIPLLFLLMLLIRYFHRKYEYQISIEEANKELQHKVEERTAELSKELVLRRETEEFLQLKSDELETIVDNTSDGIITVDSHFKILTSNRSFRAMFSVEDKRVLTSLSTFAEGYFLQLINTLVKSVASTDIITGTINPDKLESTYPDLRYTIKDISTENNTHSSLIVLRDISHLSEKDTQLVQRDRYMDMIGSSENMQEVYTKLDRIVASLSNVLILGENGTGKELIAKAIHTNSRRSDGPLVIVNSAALSEALLESELFGHVKGAFTGASSNRTGRFEAANGGTLFLDEIGDLSLGLQVKLLRVLQDGSFQRLGENHSRVSDARIISATNQDLKQKIKSGEFREDLYYRLNVINVELPALRDRSDDIKHLSDFFLNKYCQKEGINSIELNEDTLEILLEYSWPGNVRQLQNVLESACLDADGQIIYPNQLPIEICQNNENTNKPSTAIKSKTAQRSQLLRMLEHNTWNITRTANKLGISRRHLYRKMTELDIVRPK